MGFIQQFFKDLRTPLYKNAIYLMMNMILTGGLGFLFWIVVARYYSTHEVGLAATVIPFMGLIGMLSSFGLGFGLVRFLPSSRKDSTVMINSCFTISGIAAIFISLIILMGPEIFPPALLFARGDWALSLSFVVFSVVFVLYPMMNQVFVARRDARFVLASTSISGLRILFPIIVASFLGAFGIFASLSVAMLISLAIGMFLFLPRVNPGYRPFPTVKMSVIGRILHFSAGNYVWGILMVVPTALLPILILNTLSAESVAYYYVALTIAFLLYAIIDGITTSLFAEGSHFQKELEGNVRRALKFMFILLIPAVGFIFLFGDYFLLLFGSEYSTEGLLLLQIFALSSFFIALNTTFLTTRRVLKRMKPLIAIPAFNAFVIVGLGYAFLLWMGLVGVAVAWTLSRGLVSAGIGLYLLKERRKKKAQMKPPL